MTKKFTKESWDKAMIYLGKQWQEVLGDELQKEYFQTLWRFIENEYQDKTIYPPKEAIFKAFELTPFQEVKVVILGQDPYHGPHQAHGLSFSVPDGVKIPPSLRNMLKELEMDMNYLFMNETGNLSPWAKQGVLLLNTVLTVRAGQANSHKNQGWEMFTDEVIKSLNDNHQPVVFVLWGKQAQDKKKLIDLTRHTVIEGPHPSPLSAYRGFFGSKPYSKINAMLKNSGKQPIDWQL